MQSDRTRRSWRSIIRSALSPRRSFAFAPTSTWFNGGSSRAIVQLWRGVPDRTSKKQPGQHPSIPRLTNGLTLRRRRRAPGLTRLSRRRFSGSTKSSLPVSVLIGPRAMSITSSQMCFSPLANGKSRRSAIKPDCEPPSKRALISPALYQCEAILARSLERQ